MNNMRTIILSAAVLLAFGACKQQTQPARQPAADSTAVTTAEEEAVDSAAVDTVAADYYDNAADDGSAIIESLSGTWDANANVYGAQIALTTMVFDGTTGFMYEQGRVSHAVDGFITANATGNGNYEIYFGGTLVARYTDGQLIDRKGLRMSRVSSSTRQPVIVKYYKSNTYCTMGDYGIEDQYVYKTFIEQREYDNHGMSTFKIIEQGTNRVAHLYTCGTPSQSWTDKVRHTVNLQFGGQEASNGGRVKIIMAYDYSDGELYKFYITDSNGECRMYDSEIVWLDVTSN